MYLRHPFAEAGIFLSFFETGAGVMVMMVAPPAAAKTRLPAGFLTTLAFLYNQCLPLPPPGRRTETTHEQTQINLHSQI